MKILMSNSFTDHQRLEGNYPATSTQDHLSAYWEYSRKWIEMWVTTRRQAKTATDLSTADSLHSYHEVPYVTLHKQIDLPNETFHIIMVVGERSVSEWNHQTLNRDAEQPPSQPWKPNLEFTYSKELSGPHWCHQPSLLHRPLYGYVKYTASKEKQKCSHLPEYGPQWRGPVV